MARFPPLFESAGRLTVLTARLPAAGQFRTYAALGSVTVGRGQRLVITGEGPPAGQVAAQPRTPPRFAVMYSGRVSHCDRSARLTNAENL